MTLKLGRNDLAKAVEILKVGGTVAFPTETVYGLGADASNPAAVSQIFKAKGRPANHPLIVHIGSPDSFDEWAAPEADDRARVLAEAFWPGPLTLVVPHNGRVADEVVSGRATVGLRVPDHDVALDLLRSFGGGLAGPSANRFGHVSPTTAQHVLDDLSGLIDAVIDGGPCGVGVESTIIEFAGGAPTLLRLGGLPVNEISEVLGQEVLDGTGSESRAAGMMESHYSPRARLFVAQSAHPKPGDGVIAPFAVAHEPSIALGDDAADYARGLYAALRELDNTGVERIHVVPPGHGRLLTAVLDRLRKASA